MSSWFSNLVGTGWSSTLDAIEAAFTEIGIVWVRSSPEVKFRTSEVFVEALQRLIADYDLSKNIYPQIAVFSIHSTPEILQEGAGRFSQLGALGKEKNETSAFVALGMIGQLLNLLGFMKMTNIEAAKQRAGEIFSQQSRAANDIVQFYLFALAAASLNENEE